MADDDEMVDAIAHLARTVPMPGRSCELCGEPVLVPAPVRPLIAHRECLLREVVGGIGHLIAHDYWCTERHDPDAGLTYRQSAKLVDAYVATVGTERTVTDASTE